MAADVVLVNYQAVSLFTPGTSPVVSGYAAMTTLAQDMIALFDGATLTSGYLGNPGSISTIAPGGTIPFTAYGVYSDGSTRAVSPYI